VVGSTRSSGKATAMKPMNDEHFAVLRRHMVEVIAIHADLMSDELGKDTLDDRVMSVMMRVPRHRFVPEQLAPIAYHDTPLPIGFDKTISQPFINALMTDLLALEPTDAVLEIGTGLGYHAAVLSELAGAIWTVEVVEELAGQAERRLQRLGYLDVGLRVGDGSRGWSEHAPYDKILVTAAAERVPSALLDQLRPGGRIVMPLGGTEAQMLATVDKGGEGPARVQRVMPVQFGLLETVI
jgi:protein-L-isoaspartate(D-aspartate) O-methyltransferase